MVEALTDYPLDVKRNDEIDLKEVGGYDFIILSPGPGLPDEAGILKELIKEYGATKRIFGVCLGLQAIAEVYGAQLKNLDKVFHGIKTTMIKTPLKDDLLEGIAKEFEAGRYHSWVIDKSTLPDCLEVICEDAAQEIMGIRHKSNEVYAVQFHPESIMTPDGEQMMKNFLKLS